MKASPPAPVAPFKVRSAKAVTRALRLMAFVLFAGLASVVAAHAQTTGGTSTLGADGGPTGADYLSAGSGFANNIGPILKSVLPLMLGMLAVWQGPRIIKGLVQRFSH